MIMIIYTLHNVVNYTRIKNSTENYISVIKVL